MCNKMGLSPGSWRTCRLRLADAVDVRLYLATYRETPDVHRPNLLRISSWHSWLLAIRLILWPWRARDQGGRVPFISFRNSEPCPQICRSVCLLSKFDKPHGQCDGGSGRHPALPRPSLGPGEAANRTVRIRRMFDHVGRVPPRIRRRRMPGCRSCASLGPTPVLRSSTPPRLETIRSGGGLGRPPCALSGGIPMGERVDKRQKLSNEPMIASR